MLTCVNLKNNPNPSQLLVLSQDIFVIEGKDKMQLHTCTIYISRTKPEIRVTQVSSLFKTF